MRFPPPTLAEDVLPFFRTRNSELWHWRAANAYGNDAYEGLAILEEAVEEGRAAEVYPVVVKAIASTVRAILRADDSSGIIGDVIHRLLALHALLAGEVKPPARPLVDWLMRFHFDGTQDYFEVDPAHYVEALGKPGMDLLRAALDAVAAEGLEFGKYEEPFEWISLAPRGVTYTLKFRPGDRSSLLRRFATRFAVLDKDSPRVVELIAGTRTGAHVARPVAEALIEMGDIDGAIRWARTGAEETEHGIHERRCATLWCALLAEHRPAEEVEARRWVVSRFPTSVSAAELKRASGPDFDAYLAETEASLLPRPDEYVTFLGWVQGDIPLAWAEAERLSVTSPHLWERLCSDYGPANPQAVIPVLRELVEIDLEKADARQYQIAATRLVQMRRLALAADATEEFDAYVAQLRDEHRRRPRLQQEFTRRGL